MPVFKQHAIFELARGLKAFVRLELGLTRGAVPWLQPGKDGHLDTLREQLANREREIAELRTKLAAGTSSGGVDPKKMVWIFGSGRSGSTWLRSMMAEMEGHLIWEEPTVGALFGGFYTRAETGQLGSVNFIMGDPTREGWIRSIRNFVLDGAVYRHPNIGPEDYLIVKEPNGSAGAPLLMEALPESRMIFLVRDPRDVVASALDGAREGSWLNERKNNAAWKRKRLADRRPDAFVEQHAKVCSQQLSGAKQAYDAHEGPKVLVRYEELRADTLGTMRRLYEELGIPYDEGRLRAAVEKHAWENIPEEKKGEGKFFRKATPGGWREDLTPKQVEIVEEITAPLIAQFYPVEQEA